MINARSGFSLLELLVALALLSAIAVGLAGAFRLGTETFDRTRDLEAHSDEVAARVQLRHLLSRTTSPSLLTPFPKEFRGDSTSLSFVSLAPLGAFPDAAGSRIEIQVSERILQMTIVPFDDRGAELASHVRDLAHDVDRATMSYFDGRSDNRGWSDVWTEETTLPRLIRIELSPGSEPDWPEFTVPLLYAD